jgi:hypothetical protein
VACGGVCGNTNARSAAPLTSLQPPRTSTFGRRWPPVPESGSCSSSPPSAADRDSSQVLILDRRVTGSSPVGGAKQQLRAVKPEKLRRSPGAYPAELLLPYRPRCGRRDRERPQPDHRPLAGRGSGPGSWIPWSAPAGRRSAGPTGPRSSSVAAVFRNTWLVTQANSSDPRALRRSREVLDGSRQPPRESGNTGPWLRPGNSAAAEHCQREDR